MKRLHFKQNVNRVLSVLAVFFILGTAFDLFFAFADDESSKPGQDNENKRVHITSDNMISDREANYLEFFGNVRASQEKTVITADRLKIYYKSGLDKKENQPGFEESIKKILASGNVTIEFDDKVAVADQAVYMMETGILVLTGANSTITSGNNFISGEKITLHRADGRITVEGSQKKRVEATFYSKEKGADLNPQPVNRNP